MLNQETQVIMSEDSLPSAGPAYCDVHHSRTDLDLDGRYCTKDSSTTKDFSGNHENHEFFKRCTKINPTENRNEQN